ncbi:MAG: beta-ketoacyl synthase [Bacteroidota bacterium]
MSATPVIATTGARTPLGLSAPASAAALRAGLNGVKRHPFMVDREGEPMPLAPDLELETGTTGTDRFSAILESAIREACASLDGVSTTRPRVPAFVALPEPRPGFTAGDADAILSALPDLASLPIRVSELHPFALGHAGGLIALQSASEWIRSGTSELCLVAGVESYFEPATMDWLEGRRQLAVTNAPSPFIPGEAAGACLVMSDRLAARLGLSPLATVLTVANGWEDNRMGTQTVCTGEGLAATLAGAFGDLPAPRAADDVICDVNGERYRGEEWGLACLRLAPWVQDPSTYRAPADGLGDLGAAFGPVSLTLACEAGARGYANGPLTLIWSSSERGDRAAALLEIPGLDG